MSNELQDRHVVITGASGELGAVVAKLLAARGATCHLPLRSKARLDPALARAHAVEGIDLADETAVAAFFRDLPALWASIHCAGAFAASPIAEAGAGELEDMLARNARSAFLSCREAARKMRQGGRGGRIVNVVSRQALEPRRGAGLCTYTMSKAAVAALTLALAEELAPEGILVNAVAPSILDTPANRAAMPKADFTRWVKLEDLAREILWLASSECSASGTLVPVYGRA